MPEIMPPSPFGPIPSGEEIYRAAAQDFAASEAARASVVDPVGGMAPMPAAPARATEEHLAPYREPGKRFDLYVPGSSKDFYRLTLDDLLSSRGQTDKSGRAMDDYQIAVTNPEGERVGVRLGDLEQALVEGHKIETAQEATARRFLDANDLRGWKGAVAAGADRFANEVLLGIPDAVFERTQDDYERAVHESLLREHEFASTAGSVAGFAGSLVAGGPLFKGAAAAGRTAGRVAQEAAAKAIAGRLAESGIEVGARSAARDLVARSVGSAATLGTEAAVIAAPKAITEEMLGDHEAAAETLLFSLGGGAALGAVAPGAKELFSRAARAVIPKGEGAALDRLANSQSLKSLNPIQKFSARFAEVPGGEQAAGRILREKGLYRRVGEDFEELLARTADARAKTGEELGVIYGALDEKGVVYDSRAVAQRLRKEILAPLEKGVGFEARAAKVERYIESFEQKAERELRAGDLFEIRRSLDDLIYGERMPGPEQVDKQLKSIRGLFKEELDARVESALGQEAKASLEKLNREFQVLSIAAKSAEHNIRRTISNRTNGLTDYIMGATTGAIGGPVGTLAGMFGNKWMRENFNSIAAQGADKLGILMAEQSMRRAGRELERVPAMLENLGAYRTAAATVPADIMARFMGEQAEGRSRKEQFRALSERLSQFTSDPEGSAKRMGDLSRPFAVGGAPKTAEAYQGRQVEAYRYLLETMPRPTEAPAPFTKVKAEPSPAQILAWERRVEVVDDPFAAFRHLEKGTLTHEHVETLQRIYPRLYSAMVARVTSRASDKGAPQLPMPARQRLSLLLGVPLGPGTGPSAFARLQAGYRAEAQAQAAQRAGAKVDAPDPTTEIQRVSAS